MVRRLERRDVADAVGGQRAAQGAYGRDLQLFGVGQRAHDAGHARGEHRLAGTGRPDHDHVMPSRGRHLQRPFRLLLPDYLAHVAGPRQCERFAVPARPRRFVPADGHDLVRQPVFRSASHEFDELAHVPHADYVHPADEMRLLEIAGRQDHLSDTAFTRVQEDGQYAVDGQHRAVEVHLSHDDGVDEALVRNRAGRAEHGGRDGKVMRRTAFRHARRTQVHGHACLRPMESGRLAGGFDAFARFGQGGVRQSDDREVRQARADERLHGDGERLQSDQSDGQGVADGHQNAPGIWWMSGRPSRTTTVTTSKRTPVCPILCSGSSSHCTPARRRFACFV